VAGNSDGQLVVDEIDVAESIAKDPFMEATAWKVVTRLSFLSAFPMFVPSLS
jgi:hypothetical protein